MGANPSKLSKLVREGNLKALQEGLAKYGAHSMNIPLDSAGTTCLIIAAHSHRPHVVEWLLGQKADTSHKDGRGWTALHWACSAGDVGAAAALMAGGADSSMRDKLGRLPRHLLTQACDAASLAQQMTSEAELRDQLRDGEIYLPTDATHSLGIPMVVYSGVVPGGQRLVGSQLEIQVLAPQYHSEYDYVQLYVEKPSQSTMDGQENMVRRCIRTFICSKLHSY